MAKLLGVAVFDKAGIYRTFLMRRLRDPDPQRSDDAAPDAVLFIMLNPSTANGDDDDPTVRACVAMAKQWTVDEVWIVNLFALVATDPRTLKGHPDPVGPATDAELVDKLRRANMVICAWGSHASEVDPTRAAKVRALLREHAPSKSFALVINRDGSPRHPLYVKRTQALVRYP